MAQPPRTTLNQQWKWVGGEQSGLGQQILGGMNNALTGYFSISGRRHKSVLFYTWRTEKTSARKHQSDSLQCFHDATCQPEHDGQLQPQGSITGEERLILDTALWCIDEK